jgi:hypothetical protein
MRPAVFEDPSGDLWIQISAPDLPTSRWLFASGARGSNPIVGRMNRAEYVEVPLGEEKIVVFFLVVASVPPVFVERSFRKIGSLEPGDSIDVLNHLVDVLAYPSWDT